MFAGPSTGLGRQPSAVLCRCRATPRSHPPTPGRGLLGRSGEPTVGAILLFAPKPQVWFPESTVRVLRYRGRERGSGPRQQLLADRRIDRPIPHQFAAAREQIRELLPSRRALVRSGRFENVGLIPEDAWLEGLVNAVVHRSYSISGDHTRVEIFDDRIEIESPGRFPGLADPSDPLHVTRFARNTDRSSVLGSGLWPGTRRGHSADVRGNAAGRSV